MSGPVRTCVGCGRKAPQEELARYVLLKGELPGKEELARYVSSPGGTLEPDPERRRPGRGAYTCRRAVCFERAAQRRAFSRTLRRTVTVPAGSNPFSQST